MSFPRYPAYKDSGVEWLGEVPAHWVIAALGFRYRVELGKMLDAKNITGDFLAPYLRNTDVQWGRIRVDDLPMMDFSPSERERFLLRDGDILVCEGGEVGRSAIWRGQLEECYYQKALHRLRRYLPYKDIAEYQAWALNAAASHGTFVADESKATIAHLPADSFRKYRFAFPPIEEQRAIAAFLDRETGRIDALVAEQQQLISLLREKRQAVISHAVTKGLDPTVPMRDSGVEWLGEVPAHWTVTSVRRILRHVEQGWSPDCYSRSAETNEWGVLRSGCVNRGVFNENDNKALPPELTPVVEYEVRVGDILVSRASGSPTLVGSTAYVFATRPKLMLSDKVFRVRVRRTIEPRFFVWAFNTQNLRGQIEQAISGAEGLANNLPQAQLRTFWFPVPPIAEQQSIVNYLDRTTARIDTLIHEAEQAITLMQERRAALISAAVTGQIDVRQRSSEVAA